MKKLMFAMMAVALLAGCTEMDDMDDTRETVSSIVVAADGTQYIVEVTYTSAIAMQEALALANSVTLVESEDIGIVGGNETLSVGSVIPAANPHWDEVGHEFTVVVKPFDRAQRIQYEGWNWVEPETVMYRHCPPGH
ncbi:MAG: hypothetical protein KC561_13985 [Myxococcales bacterium]|nr:hypothetical protein [Myxococcales bacterium]